MNQTTSMKILILGAGVIGRIYASRLFDAGIDVTLLARDKNHETIKRKGVEVRNILTDEKTIGQIPLTTRISSNESYDLIIVTVRLDQLETIHRILNDSKSAKAIMFMLNNIENINDLQNQYPDRKVILGFPGVGGTLKNDIIDYIQIKQQKTTIGDLNGETSTLTENLQRILIQAGFQTVIEKNMKWWLKTHAVFITCVSAAIIKEGGNSISLGNSKKRVKEMVNSVEEGFKSLQELGINITPKNVKTIFLTMPNWFSVWYWQRAMKGDMGRLAIAPHVNIATQEMQLLAQNVLDLVHLSSNPTPTLDNLLTEFINAENRLSSP